MRRHDSERQGRRRSTGSTEPLFFLLHDVYSARHDMQRMIFKSLAGRRWDSSTQETMSCAGCESLLMFLHSCVRAGKTRTTLPLAAPSIGAALPQGKKKRTNEVVSGAPRRERLRANVFGTHARRQIIKLFIVEFCSIRASPQTLANI